MWTDMGYLKFKLTDIVKQPEYGNVKYRQRIVYNGNLISMKNNIQQLQGTTITFKVHMKRSLCKFRYKQESIN